MTDQDFVRICISEVCRKSGYGNQDTLMQRDYENISQDIQDKTGTMISVSTLKRLQKGDFARIPQTATLNAIATYIGYRSWQDFKKSARAGNETIPETAGPRIPKKKRYRVVIYALPIMVLLAGALFLILSLKSKSIAGFETAKFSFRKTTANDIPNSVIFSYDVTGVEADSFFIQQSWDRDRRVKISRDGHTLTDIYYEPGYHVAKLIANDSVIKTLDVSIPTDRWVLYSRENKSNSITRYIDAGNAFRDGVFTVRQDDLDKAGVPVAEEANYIYCYFPSEIEVNSDSYTYETRVRMREVRKNRCPTLMLEIFCQRHFTYFISTPKGCSSESSVQFGESARYGKQHDLSAFGMDIFQWHDVRIEVKNKQVSIFIDNSRVYTDSYQQSSGKITGLGFISNGLCEIEHVSLVGGNGETVYKSDW